MYVNTHWKVGLPLIQCYWEGSLGNGGLYSPLGVISGKGWLSAKVGNQSSKGFTSILQKIMFLTFDQIVILLKLTALIPLILREISLYHSFYFPLSRKILISPYEHSNEILKRNPKLTSLFLQVA